MIYPFFINSIPNAWLSSSDLKFLAWLSSSDLKFLASHFRFQILGKSILLTFFFFYWILCQILTH